MAWRYKAKLLGPLLRELLTCLAEYREDDVQSLSLSQEKVVAQLVADGASAFSKRPEDFARWLDSQLVLWVTRSSDVELYHTFLEELDTRAVPAAACCGES